MKKINSINAMQQLSRQMLAAGKSIGLVPTMGALHQGHVSLIDQARVDNDFVVVSIFVNPKQFSANEDLDKYPKKHEHDLQLCLKHGADAVFMPEINEIYPSDFQSSVEVSGLDAYMCGANRPGHFKGVTTVIAKLFNIVKPHNAYFGQKDWQQCAIIKKMTRDLNFDLNIITCPIIRDTDGLALSSRNAYLSAQERSNAAVIPKALQAMKQCIENGEKNTQTIKQQALELLLPIKNMSVEYLVLVDPDTLLEVDSMSSNVLAALALKLGSTRLIDNILVEI